MHTVLTSHRMLIENTNPLASPARSPQPGDRSARGVNVNSFPALVNSTTNYVITPTRSQLASRARFDVRATILSPAGIPSTTFEAILIQVTP